MSNTDSSTEDREATEARSNKERALSRAADALARYMSDSRGWASPTIGPEVMEADDRGDERDALKDLIADLTHLAEHMATRTILSTPSRDGQRDSVMARLRAERTVRAGITSSYAEWEGDAFSPPLSSVPFDVIEYVEGSEVQS